MPSIISYAELVGPPSLYQGFPNNTVHLSGGPGTVTDGYAVVSQRVIDRLVLHAQCPADLNGDGFVDGADLGTMLAGWGPCQTQNPSCVPDLNFDGIVDGGDLAILLAGWGPCPP